MRPPISLGLLVVFALVTFGLRSAQHRRETGSSGFVGMSSRVGSAGWLGGVLFGLSCVLAAGAPVAELAALVGPVLPVTRAMAIAGAAIAALGIGVTYAAQRAMGRSWRIGVRESERTELVVSGPFRIVRNPIFSCMMLTGIGLALLLPNPIAIASLACLFTGVELQVRAVEEPYLRRVHGERYAAYCARVGRFVPFLGRG